MLQMLLLQLSVLSHVMNADKAGWQSSGRLLPSLKDVAFIFVSETLGLGNFRGAHPPCWPSAPSPSLLGGKSNEEPNIFSIPDQAG